MLAPVGPLRSGFRPPPLGRRWRPLAAARRRSGASAAASGGTGGPRRFPPWPPCLGLSAPALARRSGGSCPPARSLRPALRRWAARRPALAPVPRSPSSRCGLRCARPPLPSGSLRPLGGSAWAGAPPPPPLRGCAALALAAPAGGPQAGLRPAVKAPGPPASGGVGRRCGGVAPAALQHTKQSFARCDRLRRSGTHASR